MNLQLGLMRSMGIVWLLEVSEGIVPLIWCLTETALGRSI